MRSTQKCKELLQKVQPMMNTNVDLTALNTFGIQAKAKEFLEIQSKEQLIAQHKIIKNANKRLILGGGSNVLFLKDFNGLVVSNQIKGKETKTRQNNQIVVTANAGENWHEFVLWCLKNNYGGLENLSLIPGKVGAAPMQNIGAYGVEIKDVFYELEAVEIASGTRHIFNAKDCEFGYRESVFKKELKNQFMITSVSFLLRTNNHQLNYDYGSIQEQLQANGIKNPSIQDISQAVVQIRESKLPNPKEIGNGGSFFKNPVIDLPQFESLQKEHPTMPFYQLENNHIKIPAAWLIEKVGFKGKKYGFAGVHYKQALVLINLGKATGKDIYALSEQILQAVQQQFGIGLEREVNIIE